MNGDQRKIAGGNELRSAKAAALRRGESHRVGRISPFSSNSNGQSATAKQEFHEPPIKSATTVDLAKNDGKRCEMAGTGGSARKLADDGLMYKCIGICALFG